MTTAEAVRRLDEADIPVAPVHNPQTLLEDPHLADVRFFAAVDHPTEGKIRPSGLTQRWSESPPSVRRYAPHLGEHTKEILAELDFTDAQIAALLEKGAATLSS